MIKKTLSSKKGASSILVILLLIVLVVFGIAALTTALSSYHLGQKVVGWNSSYYAVESAAQQHFAAIDKAVSKAHEKGDDDIANSLQKLDFATDVSISNNEMQISYETWNKDKDLGLGVTLVHDITDPTSLIIIRWKEIQ